jgi:mono/diheme cytochrome c family protein
MKAILPALITALSLPLQAQDLDAGRQHFADFCATCHGLGAKGDGPMSNVLTVAPTNLTLLAGERGGEFPIAEVVAKIDGRDPLLVHGSDMPIYGWYFEGKGVVIRDERGTPIMTSQPIIDLVTWLGSVQE